MPDAVYRTRSLEVLETKLDLVIHGVAYHHGGTIPADRHIIESLFLSGSLSVICTTSTLAVGVNLPAHLVVIKGTNQYCSGQYKRYSNMDILQMIGRAGRPQFDTFGVAVVMTSIEEKRSFENLLLGKELIESGLHESLIEHLNAEIVLGSIRDMNDAMEW